MVRRKLVISHPNCFFVSEVLVCSLNDTDCAAAGQRETGGENAARR